ncbi:MAG: hypothetical protein R3E46_18330 [Sedimenticolaceae bacterium]
MHDRDGSNVIHAPQLSAYFHHEVQGAAERRHLRADEATLHYLSLLLCQYARSERVFDFDDRHLQLRPLALIYGDALGAGSRRERRLWLQRLGDLALFVGGLFAGRLGRRFQDIEYCVAMGGNAYGYLQQTATRPQEQAQAAVFGELSDGFAQFVDLVATVTGRPGARQDA